MEPMVRMQHGAAHHIVPSRATKFDATGGDNAPKRVANVAIATIEIATNRTPKYIASGCRFRWAPTLSG